MEIESSLSTFLCSSITHLLSDSKDNTEGEEILSEEKSHLVTGSRSGCLHLRTITLDALGGEACTLRTLFMRREREHRNETEVQKDDSITRSAGMLKVPLWCWGDGLFSKGLALKEVRSEVSDKTFIKIAGFGVCILSTEERR